MSRGHRRRLVAALLLAAGLWQVASAGWIHLKAALAQPLLRGALEASLHDGRAHRPWPWADTFPVARLTAPEHGVDLVALDGLSGQALAFGPGMVRLPGGALVLCAHRDTHFHFLGRLQPGDRLVLRTAGDGPHTFLVQRSAVLDRRDAAALAGAGAGDLLLVTCWPLDAIVPGGPLRLVVHARLAAPT